MKRVTKQHTGLSGPVCICIGISCILLALGTLGINYYTEKQLLKSTLRLQQEMWNERDNLEDMPFGADGMPAKGEENDVLTNWEEGLLGSIQIPAIDLAVAVREGADRNALKDAVGHLTGTAPIGEKNGNCVIAGHRNYNFGRFFNRLDEVEVNDQVILTDMSGKKFVYRVTDKKVVSPEELSVLEATGGGELTLITCTPIYIATHRLIVHCELMPDGTELTEDVIQNDI